MARTIYRERIPSTDPRCRRHVHHDSESKRFEFDTSGLTIVSAKHTRRIPVLDQGQLGDCVPNAAEGCMGTDPFHSTVTLEWGEPLAISWYGDVTATDPYPGQYPPDDTGSDGLSMAKVLLSKGLISGYQHTFSLEAALKALTVTPWITGVNWFQDMFTPDPDGRVHPTGALAGGHEFVADEIDAEHERVWFTNSWGAGWGAAGRFYLTFADFGRLLGQQGDVTIFTPLTQPVPTPTPPTPAPADPADVTFAAVLRRWVHRPHLLGNAAMARAARTWLAAKGL
jgi:hypothetical protein